MEPKVCDAAASGGSERQTMLGQRQRISIHQIGEPPGERTAVRTVSSAQLLGGAQSDQA